MGEYNGTYGKIREVSQQGTAVKNINKSSWCRVRHCLYISIGSPPGKDRRNDASLRSSVSTALRIASTCTLFFAAHDKKSVPPNRARKRRRSMSSSSTRSTDAMSTFSDTRLSASSPQRAANKSRGGMNGSRAGSSPSSAAR